MTESIDKKEDGIAKIIDTLRNSSNTPIIEVAVLSYALGLQAGLNLKTEKDPAA